MTEIAPLWGIKVTVDAVANGFIVSCVSHGNSEIASMGNCISPTFDEALLTAIAYYNAYLPDGLKMVAPAPFPLDVGPFPEFACDGFAHRSDVPVKGSIWPCDCEEENWPGCAKEKEGFRPPLVDVECPYHDIYCFQCGVVCTSCELFHLPRLRAHIEEPENEG